MIVTLLPAAETGDTRRVAEVDEPVRAGANGRRQLARDAIARIVLNIFIPRVARRGHVAFLRGVRRIGGRCIASLVFTRDRGSIGNRQAVRISRVINRGRGVGDSKDGVAGSIPRLHEDVRVLVDRRIVAPHGIERTHFGRAASDRR